MLSKNNSRNIPSVLVVDDNADNLFLISCVLEAMGIEAYGVRDSRSVLKLAISKTPDLILIDIVMPHLSGFEVLKQLKSSVVTQNIPAIAVTGLDSLGHQLKIIGAGFDDYICKPFVLEDLEDKIAKSLGLYVAVAAA